ncbi:MAG: ImmA/IrrE family metallo-endopeptidase [Gammaproteobacteria bacterium]|nr:ImmA/IrrE family metallo-endopeptidase [Gammaproteobacteria bacterium]MYA37929.1 ImmA/IrrE family metallo-endopeptidase [Gammaproteobacteria bacterium]MYG97655.1 ImmA/IrrE family metallo-endopeptidase [Gammaproteobacteria bacterium]MYH86335.1 ImmA/IrrE family metallo-endopeptidase [Gammaproteobacteria bacterium]MYK04991.1 ImmA/IrrE family metallo-endopeptidase [Gammaproteobacteria bacterium]
MVKTATNAFDPDWISPPGDTIADLLEERNWTQAELASRLGASRKFVSQLVSGKVPLSESVAIRLARVLGSTVRFWLNREAGYRAALAKESEIETLRQDIDWLNELPVTQMRKFGWIDTHRDKARTVAECLRFFGVGTVDAWRDWSEGLGRTAYRMSEKTRSNFGAIAAWLRFGELQAQEIDCRPYSADAFKSYLEVLRSLTLEEDPEVFVPKMQQSCAEAGVAVVFAPAPTGCPASGATRWLSSDKALLMLSLRYKTNDQLWFSFFHEAAHILLHRKRLMFLEIDRNGFRDQKEEEEANQFAADMLIPRNFHLELLGTGGSRAGILAFAKKLGIAPGIVVGRLQHERVLPHSHLNDLKVRYEWT